MQTFAVLGERLVDILPAGPLGPTEQVSSEPSAAPTGLDTVGSSRFRRPRRPPPRRAPTPAAPTAGAAPREHACIRRQFLTVPRAPAANSGSRTDLHQRIETAQVEAWLCDGVQLEITQIGSRRREPRCPGVLPGTPRAPSAAAWEVLGPVDAVLDGGNGLPPRRAEPSPVPAARRPFNLRSDIGGAVCAQNP